MRSLYVFIDESGNYDFSNSGTEYWILSCITTTDTRPGVKALYDLKHQMIAQGLDLEYFHAAEDRQIVRDEVFKILAPLPNIRVDSVVVHKRKAAPSVRPMKRFYPLMAEKLLQYPFDARGLDVARYEKVLVFFDRAGAHRREQEAVRKAIKAGLKPHLRRVPYEIAMHASKSHPYLQMVDYVSWAVYVKWERGEIRPYSTIEHHIRSEFSIFEQGYKDWY